jgi:hypothetical protein
MFPPLWKVKRELHRLWLMGTGLISLCAGNIPRKIYDQNKLKKIKIYEGDRPLTKDVAIFLIYAPKGLSPSYFLTLRHLNASGFSVLVVANHPLDEETRAKISPLAWRIMSRPNFGYDFGGYREGILHLIDEGIKPENTLVMNDSVWFPLRDHDTMLLEMKKWKENIRGFSIHDHRRSKNLPFIQSFMFMYDREIFESRSFESFWRNIILSNNKVVVIRMLEMRMSIFFSERGFTTRAFFEYRNLGSIIYRMSKERQIRFLEYEKPRLGRLADESLARIRNDKFITAKTWQKIVRISQVDGHILKLPPELLFGVFESNMLKKLKADHFVAQRQMIKDGNFATYMNPDIRREIENRDCPKDAYRIMKYYRKKGRS